ncbi:MAG: glycosyltransferase family 2 protein [Mariprofundaceae bacterium]
MICIKEECEISPYVSIVIPVYNSASILPILLDSIYDEMKREQLDEQFELLLINDVSSDHSWDIICGLAERFPFVRGISLRRNSGQHNAIMAGLNHISGQYVVIMDDDLQHPPEAIGDLIRALSSGYDVCYTRYVNRQHKTWKKLGSKFNDLVATLLLNKPKGLYLSSFKAIRREISDEIVKYDGPYAYVDGLILDVTSSITSINIEHQVRLVGNGNYNLWRSLSLWSKMATGFSVLPLRLATYTGFFLALLSFVLIVGVIVVKLTDPEAAAGWASLAATVLLLGGIQALCIGMLGEYMGRTYLKINGKRQFVVGTSTEKLAEKNEGKNEKT